MIEVFFPEQVDDQLYGFSVIVARMQGKWVFSKHRQRTTLECPGGHREPGETTEETARRELWEETGATVYQLTQVGPYAVRRFQSDGSYNDTFGMLYRAEIEELGPIPEGSEIETVVLLDELPENWTYPQIQPYLLPRTWPEWFDQAAEAKEVIL